LTVPDDLVTKAQSAVLMTVMIGDPTNASMSPTSHPGLRQPVRRREVLDRLVQGRCHRREPRPDPF